MKEQRFAIDHVTLEKIQSGFHTLFYGAEGWWMFFPVSIKH
jgi:hypothetical protein